MLAPRLVSNQRSDASSMSWRQEDFYRSFLFTLFFIVSFNSFAQGPDWVWAGAMGGSNDIYCYSSTIDPSGSGDVYSTGWFSGTIDFAPGEKTYNLTSSGDADIFISKLDVSGNLVWAKAIGGEYYSQGWAIAMDPSGSGEVYLTGSFQGTADFDPGEGTYNVTSAGDGDIFVTKLDNSGNFIWARVIGGTSTDVGRSIAVDASGTGDIYLTGAFSGKVDFDPGRGTFELNSNGDVDIFIVKLSGSGKFIWAAGVGGSGFDHGYSLVPDPRGYVYITGTFQGTADFDPGPRTSNLTTVGYRDIFISKFDGSGNMQWAKSMGGAGSDADGQSIAVDPAGNGDVITTGNYFGTVDFNPGAGTYPLGGGGVFISRLNSKGDFVWAKGFNGVVYTGTDRAIAVDPSGSGDIYLTGMFYGTIDFDPGFQTFGLTSAGLADIFVSKLNSSGNFLSAEKIGSSGSDVGNTLAIDHSGNVYVAGYFNSPTIMFGSIMLTNPPTTFEGWDGTEYVYYTPDIFVGKLSMAPLGIQLVSFNVSPDEERKVVQIEWITASEINNDYFTIERSDNGIEFYSIGEVKGSGTSTEILQYNAFDLTPKGGKYYYRLRQTDYDGKTTYSNIVVVNVASKAEKVSFYPIPATNELNIEFEDAAPLTVGITMYTDSGKAVLSEKNGNGGQKETLDISSLAPGIYFIEVIADGQRIVQKVIKE